MRSVTNFDPQGSRTANGFEPWPGADDGTLSPELEDWLCNVLAPGKAVIAQALREFPSSADPERVADALVARLARHSPPLTIDRMESSP